jgi:bacterioferritin-associated ferredoxin
MSSSLSRRGVQRLAPKEITDADAVNSARYFCHAVQDHGEEEPCGNCVETARLMLEEHEARKEIRLVH